MVAMNRGITEPVRYFAWQSPSQGAHVDDRSIGRDIRPWANVSSVGPIVLAPLSQLHCRRFSFLGHSHAYQPQHPVSAPGPPARWFIQRCDHVAGPAPLMPQGSTAGLLHVRGRNSCGACHESLKCLFRALCRLPAYAVDRDFVRAPPARRWRGRRVFFPAQHQSRGKTMSVATNQPVAFEGCLELRMRCSPRLRS